MSKWVIKMSGDFILLNQSPSLAIKHFDLVEGKFIVGRSVDCEFPVFDATVSRRHAELTVADGCVGVRDLNSRNGTFVDGKRVHQCTVNHGQRLCFGAAAFQVISLGIQEEKVDSEEETDSQDNASEPLAFDETKFSVAQRRVFHFLLEGLAEKVIADRLYLSKHTVHCHVRAIYRIVQVHSRAELLCRCLRENEDGARTRS
jgi:pSer/pThr/pTyr-binding forkhead associated (FHA) protein